jgi:hypothetical protein
MADVRCALCKYTGVECPLGYFGGLCTCDVCGHRFALAAPLCAPPVTCPQCNGTVTYE